MTLAVGFIGLGAMGRGMARNLHRAGMLCGVWNLPGSLPPPPQHCTQVPSARKRCTYPRP